MADQTSSSAGPAPGQDSATQRIAELTAQLEESRREAAWLRRILDAPPVLIYQWVLSPGGDTRFSFVSRGAEKIYGVPAERLLADNRYSQEAIHPEDRPGFRQAILASAATLTPFTWEGRVVLEGGVTKWIEAWSTPSRHEDGETRWEGIIFDITARRDGDQARLAAEEERTMLVAQLRERNETLQRQAEALRELATPIIPLAAGVIALPLIGDIDPARAQQILDTLLSGVTVHRARVAIIDITGVRTLDTYGAETLVRAAQGLRLLGATAVLTGIRSGIAQALVTLGVSLEGLLTRSTFQDGIVFALREAGASSTSLR
jgi:rsbT co-antagonist protein RsbR